MAWSISAAALVFCAAVQGQQNPLTVDDAVALARPITHRDPSVHSVEVRFLGGSAQYAYFYEAPDHYHGLLGTDEFTYFAAAGSRVIIYDPSQGELVVLTSVFPGIRSIAEASDDVTIGYSLNASVNESDPPSMLDAGLYIDLPSILRKGKDGALQSLPGGKYRLVSAMKLGSLIATIDPSQGFAFTDIELVSSTSKQSIEIHVNRVPPAATPPIPSTGQLRQSIAVREVLFNMAILKDAMRLIMLTPQRWSQNRWLCEKVCSPQRGAKLSRASAKG